jgi:hypothetical protein
MRVSQLDVNPDAYKEEILSSIAFCKDYLLREGRNVELRLYDSLPIWKILMLPQVLWVQYYSSKSRVDDTALYGFTQSGPKPSLLNGFEAVFDRRWQQDATVVVDLEKFQRDQFEACLKHVDQEHLKLVGKS